MGCTRIPVMTFSFRARAHTLASMMLAVAALLALAGVARECAAGDAPARRKVIIDQDAFGPASSNLQAILMLLQSPDVEVLGITIPSGDGWRDEEVSHTLRLLEIARRTEVPVHPGAVFPLVNTQQRTKVWEQLYGILFYKGAWTETWPAEGAVRRTSCHARCMSSPGRSRSSLPARSPTWRSPRGSIRSSPRSPASWSSWAAASTRCPPATPSPRNTP